MKSYKNHTSLIGLIVVSSISLTACEPLASKSRLGTRLGIKIPIKARSVEEYSKPEDSKNAQKEEEPKFAQLTNTENLKTTGKGLEKQDVIGSGKFVSQKPGTISTSSKTEGSGKYSLNFDGADLGEVTKIILNDMLQENYVMSPKVGGTVTLQTTDPLHREELLPTLEMLLRVNGVVLVKRGGLYRVEVDGDGLQIANASGMSGNRVQAAGYQIKIIPLKYVGATDMAEIITPVLPKKSIIKIDPARNILLVAGTQEELNKILDLINTFDVNYLAGMSFGLFPLENTDVDTTIAEIEQVFNKAEKTPLSGMLRFVSIKHLNAILVITQQKAYLKEAEKWIAKLDTANVEAGEGGVIVYRVQHVDAVELASTLSQIVSGVASSTSKPPSVAPGQKIATITNKNRQAKKVKNLKPGQGNSSLEGVNVIADEANNALVITAQPQQYRMLNKIIKQLDVMPLQVLVDATIISVNLTDNLEYGMKWLFKNGIDGDLLGLDRGIGGIGTDGTNILDAAASAVAGGFSYGLVNNTGKVKVALNLLAKNKKVDVLSTPSVMVLNNKEAKIVVGNQVPIRTSVSTNTSGSTANIGNLIQTSPIQMQDTGVTLVVKPRVNANGIVIMDIEQKVNAVAAAGTNSGSNIDSPTILKREITSSVAMVSGESVILGGLMDETHTDSNTGIPLLKDIPYLGWLFGSQGKLIEKQELIVIITPRVVENQYDARKVTDEFKRKLSGIFYDQKGYQPKDNEILRDFSGREIPVDE